MPELRLDRRSLRPLAGAGYLIGILCIVFPLTDLVTNVWPIRIADVQWRYGTIGLGSGFLLTPLLGLLVIGLVALASRQSAVMRAVGVLGLLGGVLLLALTGVFVMDALQIRGAIPGQNLRGFQIAAGRAFAKVLVGSIGALWIGFGSWRAGGAVDRTSAATVRSHARSPVVGTPS